MTGKIRNVPKEIRDATITTEVSNLNQELIKLGLSPDESIALFFGDYSKIDPQKIENAQQAVSGSIVDTSFQSIAGKLQKLIFLRDHFEIDPNLTFNEWLMELCLKLADTYVGGFSSPQKVGRPQKHDTHSELKFLYQIEKMKTETACKDGEAIKAYLRFTGIAKPSPSEIKTARNRLSRVRRGEKSPFLKLVKQPNTAEVDLAALARLIEILD